MAIWFKEFPLSYAQERGRGTLIEHLGIEILEVKTTSEQECR